MALWGILDKKGKVIFDEARIPIFCTSKKETKQLVSSLCKNEPHMKAHAAIRVKILPDIQAKNQGPWIDLCKTCADDSFCKWNHRVMCMDDGMLCHRRKR